MGLLVAFPFPFSFPPPTPPPPPLVIFRAIVDEVVGLDLVVAGSLLLLLLLTFCDVEEGGRFAFEAEESALRAVVGLLLLLFSAVGVEPRCSRLGLGLGLAEDVPSDALDDNDDDDDDAELILAAALTAAPEVVLLPVPVLLENEMLS